MSNVFMYHKILNPVCSKQINIAIGCPLFNLSPESHREKPLILNSLEIFSLSKNNMKSMKINNKVESFGQKGIPIHSQVMKIKQESEKIFDWSTDQAEIRPVLREISRRISRSPLGISGQPISVGDS
jgi:hypothetical protein